MDAFANKVGAEGSIHLVSIPGGLEADSDMNLGTLTDAISRVMPGKLKEFINKMNRLEDDKITCVIADVNMGWAVDVAAELGIPGAAFWPASALMIDLIFTTNKLLGDHVIDEYGTPIDKEKMIQLSPNTPAMHPKNFLWSLEATNNVRKGLVCEDGVVRATPEEVTDEMGLTWWSDLMRVRAAVGLMIVPEMIDPSLQSWVALMLLVNALVRENGSCSHS
ncbi:UDP-glucuronosyl/UDP-glucosyltransferase [Corchorus olitorius]|uniref:UDP-glucuronosyl/UDP-glucosyltransferase n=2 Tax=Corchorus olitorius TaxID=93759 RepID=A0A1R3HZL3_9ROSI|nr:UDP-glucuronosyl/UDP-glucosyltransferase [Corchorus olitorius]